MPQEKFYIPSNEANIEVLTNDTADLTAESVTIRVAEEHVNGKTKPRIRLEDLCEHIIKDMNWNLSHMLC